MSQTKLSIAQMLEQSKALKEKQAQINAELKNQKNQMYVMFTENLTQPQIDAEIERAEKLLASADVKAQALKEKFKLDMLEIKESVSHAKELLDMANHKVKNSLPSRTPLVFTTGESKAVFHRAGIEPIEIDFAVNKAEYKKVFTENLIAQGVSFKAYKGDTNKAGENIVSKVSIEIENYKAQNK